MSGFVTPLSPRKEGSSKELPETAEAINVLRFNPNDEPLLLTVFFSFIFAHPLIGDSAFYGDLLCSQAVSATVLKNASITLDTFYFEVLLHAKGHTL